MKRYMANVSPTLADKKAAQVAVAKGKADSVKSFYEHAISEHCKAFYEECAMLEGVTLDEWLEKASKGEF